MPNLGSALPSSVLVRSAITGLTRDASWLSIRVRDLTSGGVKPIAFALKGAVILPSQDGGRSWLTRPFHPDWAMPIALTVLQDELWVIASVRPHGAYGLYRQGLGFELWTRHDPVGFPALSESASIGPLSATEAWLSFIAPHSGRRLWKSTNNGAAWAPWSVPRGWDPMSVVSERANFWLSATTFGGRGGLWSARVNEPWELIQRYSSPGYAVAAHEETVAICGHFGLELYQSDGRRLSHLPVDDGDFLESVAMASRGYAAIGSGKRLYISRDGGSVWDWVELPSRLDCASVCWAGDLLICSDGFDLWHVDIDAA